jgi:hypothetical protein
VPEVNGDYLIHPFLCRSSFNDTRSWKHQQLQLKHLNIIHPPTTCPTQCLRHLLPLYPTMAGSRTDRVYHQDYIARIRYSNTLPPPPNPPKLLDIPDASLASGQYTSTSFAARLSREQPLNIEADAELGMPLNLIGLPGVFDGDESSKIGITIS